MIFLFLLMGISATVTAQVLTGIDVLQASGFDLLNGKRVGLVTNPTGVDRHLNSTIDILHANTNLTALFGPEHGVRGSFSAGDHVGDRVDERTGVPVYSLYGRNRRPDSSALEKVDVIVYDIQDIGVRSYTYISTMGMVMEAAADHQKEVVILDRPNPLGGCRVEGLPVEAGFHSFVSRYSIPYLYGLTCGELALMLNGEGMLEGGKKCSLQVVPMEGWKREMTYGQTGLLWVPPSPHIPHFRTVFYNAITGILGELDPNMVGIGYTLPFQTLVTGQINAEVLADSMNALGLEGVIFRPIYLRPYYMAREGEELRGVQIHLTNPGKTELTGIQFHFIREARKIDPSFHLFRRKEERYRMFDQVCGTDRIRRAIMDNGPDKALGIWKGDTVEREAFMNTALKYHLYDSNKY
ncbi:MAG: exo-beta-N-acetylmuramidase NamZ family protein [Bacteroidota bacterium]